MRRAAVVLSCIGLWATLSPPVSADEGQWTPEQIHELDAAELKRMGLELEPSQLWDESGGGLMRAAVNLSGCSAAFISDRGLVATNHHCAYSALQAQSSVDRDYLADGFLAKTPADELEAKGRTVRVLRTISDVTERVHAVRDAQSDPAARARAVEQERKTIVKECEDKGDGLRCSVASFYRGATFKLFEALELRDIRLVYAPPSAIGEYGGEIDNWMWPRHTGDFTLLRAYVGADGKPADHAPDNAPFEPEHHLAIGHEGVAPGDFVAVLGYPGRTNRYLSAAEVQRSLEQFLPARVDLYGAWIDFLEQQGARDPAVKIKVAAKLKGLANRHKNARGMIAGLRRNEQLAKRRKEDEQLRAWAEQQGDAKYKNVLAELAKLDAERRRTFDRDFLLGSATYGSNALALGVDVVRRAREADKPDLEREASYMDRNAKRLWRAQERRLRDFDAEVEIGLLDDILERVGKLPEGDRFLDASANAKRVISGTKLFDPAATKALFDEPDLEAVNRSKDPLLVLSRTLADHIETHERRERERDGQMLLLGPAYFEALKAVRQGPIYPDANGTLRFSYATVQGYEPRDGLQATPQTTLAGAIVKHTGTEPFDLPEPVREAAVAARSTYWADPELRDIPICFLSNADTTGGNSGSPAINGRGELVGFNFDRVWENISGDYGYNIPRSRNVVADVRYLLWLLDDVADGGAILDELGLTKLREEKIRASGGRAATAQLQGVGTPAPPDPGCNCSASGSGMPPMWAFLGLLGLRRRR